MYFAYVYGFLNGFAREATYCVCKSIALRVKRLMRSKRLMSTNEYRFARKATYVLEATYAYKVRLLRVNLPMLQGLSWTRRRGDDSPADPRCFFYRPMT